MFHSDVQYYDTFFIAMLLHLPLNSLLSFRIMGLSLLNSGSDRSTLLLCSLLSDVNEHAA